MFSTFSLTDASFLLSNGRQPPSLIPQGDFVEFTFNLTEQEARALLASREREVCERFHFALRRLRKEIDRVQGRNGDRR